MSNTDKFGDLCESKAQELTELLKDDVRWLISRGDIFNPEWGPKVMFTEGEDGIERLLFEPRKIDDECMTCILGAHLVHCTHEDVWPRGRPERDRMLDGTEEIFAKEQGIEVGHASAIYYGAMLSSRVKLFPRAAMVAVDVLNYAIKKLGWDCENVGMTQEQIDQFKADLKSLIEERGT